MKTVMLIENNERASKEVSAQLSWSFSSLFVVGSLGRGCCWWGGLSCSHGGIEVDYDS